MQTQTIRRRLPAVADSPLSRALNLLAQQPPGVWERLKIDPHAGNLVTGDVGDVLWTLIGDTQTDLWNGHRVPIDVWLQAVLMLAHADLEMAADESEEGRS